MTQANYTHPNEVTPLRPHCWATANTFTTRYLNDLKCCAAYSFRLALRKRVGGVRAGALAPHALHQTNYADSYRAGKDAD